VGSTWFFFSAYPPQKRQTTSLFSRSDFLMCADFCYTALFLIGDTLKREKASHQERSREMPKHLQARLAKDEREERQVRKLAGSHHAPADWKFHA